MFLSVFSLLSQPKNLYNPSTFPKKLLELPQRKFLSSIKMKFPIPIIFVLLACATAGLGSERKSSINKATLKALPAHQKLGILAASHFLKKTFPADLTFSDLFSSDDMPWIDYMFVDIRNFFVQSIKVTENQGELPELDWSYNIFYDDDYFIDVTISYTTSGTQMVGQKGLSSLNEITPNSFKNNFHVPSYTWRSPNASFFARDNFENYSIHCEDWYLGVNGLTLNTSLNYEYVPDLGIQVRNLSIDFDVNYWRTNVEDIYYVYPNGTREYNDPIKWDYQDILLNQWKFYQVEYLDALEFRINCVLSDNQNNPDRCGLQDGWVKKEYFKMNVLQLIETIGLATLDRR